MRVRSWRRIDSRHDGGYMATGSFGKMIGVPSLQPLSKEQAAEVDAFHQHVRKNVVPVIVRQVTERETRAVQARKIFIR
jgi:hypothetical protein